MLILLLIVAFILDTINSYLKIGLRRTVAQGYPPELGLPLAFMGPWRLELVFILSLIVGFVLLVYGIYLLGFLAGIGCRMVPWIAGKIAARVLDSFLHDF